MKKRIAAFLCVILVFSLLPLSAFAVTEGDWGYEFIGHTTEIMINEYMDDGSAGGDITIPSELDGYPVTSLAPALFPYYTWLTGVTIPDSVTSINEGVFAGCSGLTGIVIPGSVKLMGTSVFSGCTGLTSAGPVGSGCSIEYNWTESIPDFAFSYSALQSVIIPETVTRIGDSAFAGCDALQSVTIPESVTQIGDSAFSECSALQSVTIPNSVTQIGRNVFDGCDALTDVWYDGTPEQWYAISGSYMPDLATIHFSQAIVHFDPNGGSGEMEDAVLDAGEEYALPDCAFTPPEGMRFRIWRFDTVEMNPGDRFNPTDYNTITAEWESTAVRVVFYENSNPAHRTGHNDPIEANIGDEVTLPACNIDYEGHVFTGWNTDLWGNGTAYQPGDKVTLGDDFDLELYAQWKEAVAPPAITAEPENARVKAGETVRFFVEATGDDLTYQWYVSKDGGATWTKIKSDSTSAVYKLVTAERHNSYRYRCEVKNDAGTAQSGEATLTVFTASKPVVTAQPKDVTVVVGKTATFIVAATGADSFQWQYRKSADSGWTNVSAASGKTASYSLTAQTKHDGYQYRCRVKNAAGNTYSAVVTLTVSTGKPTITTQPKDVTVAAGKTAKFTVAAAGADSFQWQYKKPGGTWTSVSAASGKTASYSLTAQTKHDGYQYRVKVKNSAGTTISSVVTLTVSAGKPTITAQPKALTVAAGATAKFTVAAAGADSFQWQYKKPGGTWTSVSAASGKTASYSLTAQTKHDGYQYRVKVKNSAGTTISSVVTLTVSAGKPVITAQPKDVTVAVGATAKFTVAAAGADSFQWQYKKPDGSWTSVSAASGKTASYSLTAQAKHDGYQYRCKVTNAAGTTISAVVTLTVSADVPTVHIFFYENSDPARRTGHNEPITANVGDEVTLPECNIVYEDHVFTGWNTEYRGEGTAYQPGDKVTLDGDLVLYARWEATGASPRITAQPDNVTVAVGKTVKFTVAADDAESFQWQYLKPTENTWTNVSAASGKTASYSLNAQAKHDGYQYRCKVTNAAGSAYSAVAILTVK